MADIPKPGKLTDVPTVLPRSDIAPPTTQLLADSLPAGASGSPTVRERQAPVAGTEISAVGYPTDAAVQAQIQAERSKYGPSWQGPDYFEDSYDRLNQKPDSPVALNKKEQKVADELLAAVKAARTLDQPLEQSGVPGVWNAARKEMAKIVETNDAATINKIIPTVNEQLAHTPELSPQVRLAVTDPHKQSEVILGVKSLSGKNDYLVNYYVGRERNPNAKLSEFLRLL